MSGRSTYAAPGRFARRERRERLAKADHSTVLDRLSRRAVGRDEGRKARRAWRRIWALNPWIYRGWP